VRRATVLALIAALVGLAVRLRPAPVRLARVTSVQPGPPATASLTLVYGGGAMPHSLVLDVFGASGAGSAAVEGGPHFVEVVLEQPLLAPYRVRVTAAYRVLGRLVVRRYAG
jgi:hypothetical protein